MPQQMILHASMKIKDPTCYNYNPMQPNQYFKKKKKDILNRRLKVRSINCSKYDRKTEDKSFIQILEIATDSELKDCVVCICLLFEI